MKKVISFASEKKSLTIIVILGLILRLIDINKAFSGLGKWNEGHYSVTALNHFRYGLLLPVNEYNIDLTTTPLYSWLIHLSFRIFGVHEWAARLPSLFFGILSLILIYHITEKLYSEKVALAATFISAVSPGIVYFSRNIQLEAMFSAFTLFALLFLMYYKDTYDIRWLAASGIYLSIAILTKYPAVLVYPSLLWVWFRYGKSKQNHENKGRLLLYIILPLIPALIWLLFALTFKPELTVWYFNKPEVSWNIGSAATAFYLAVTKYIPEHFGYLFYIPFVLTLPLALKDFKKHMTILLFTFSWLVLIIAFPDFYMSNMYYHFTMLYGMSILLGFFTVKFGERFQKNLDLHFKAVGAGIVLISLVLSLYQYNIYFHSYYTDFSVVNEPEPFYSAQVVAKENVNHDLVVADLPMTLFYLGGDPEYIKLAYTTQGLINAVKEGRYTYLVTYYEGNRTLKEVLDENDYAQIAPRAWKKSG